MLSTSRRMSTRAILLQSSNKISLFLVMNASGNLSMFFFIPRARSIESIFIKKKRKKRGKTAERQIDAQVREIAISSTTFEKIAPRLFWSISWILIVFTSFGKRLFTRLLLRKVRNNYYILVSHGERISHHFCTQIVGTRFDVTDTHILTRLVPIVLSRVKRDINER